MATEIRVATDEDLAWAAQRIGIDRFRDDARGITLARDGRLAAVTVYDCWTATDCHMHLASDGTGRWMTRTFLLEAFFYPFVTSGRRRVTGMVDTRNERAIALNLHLGFVIEGKCEDAAPDGDMFVMGLTRRKCRFIAPERRL